MGVATQVTEGGWQSKGRRGEGSRGALLAPFQPASLPPISSATLSTTFSSFCLSSLAVCICLNRNLGTEILSFCVISLFEKLFPLFEYSLEITGPNKQQLQILSCFDIVLVSRSKKTRRGRRTRKPFGHHATYMQLLWAACLLRAELRRRQRPGASSHAGLWLRDSWVVVVVLEKMYLFFIYEYGCFAYMYACVPHVCSILGSQKKVLNSLELELQMAVSHRVGTGKWTLLLLWNSSQCS